MTSGMVNPIIAGGFGTDSDGSIYKPEKPRRAEDGSSVSLLSYWLFCSIAWVRGANQWRRTLF